MMVVVVDTRKPLYIKGISLQQPYNQQCFASSVKYYVNGCTLVVAPNFSFSMLSTQLQLQQQT